MSNSLAAMHPELVREWSDKNLPLTPDKITYGSNKIVWWKAVCGHEWQGYNDLATTDPCILAEWDYDKNTDILPTQISRNSMRYVWWKCSFGHSRRDRISNSTIEHKRCPTCEADFDTVLPQLLVLYYAKQNHIKVELDDEDTLGIRISAYIPEIKLGFDFPSKGTQLEKDIGAVTAHLCKRRGIQYVRLSNTQNRESVCSEIRKGFGKAHIFITSDSDEDMRQVYDIFFEWRKKGL